MEDWLVTQFGKKDPFKVPEGYFDTLPQRVMSRIPDEKPSLFLQPRHRRWLAGLSIAAAFVGLILLLAALYTWNMPADQHEMLTEEDPNMEELMDYTMMDSFTMHQYLTEASTDYE